MSVVGVVRLMFAHPNKFSPLWWGRVELSAAGVEKAVEWRVKWKGWRQPVREIRRWLAVKVEA